mmetsp:Transcript_12082/g.30530  ORF Transcript_12082/g.30530 Transcript_12082/m.30530 type:complete len:335 (-) Transcript_12082:7363-8367(-)
MRHASGRSAMAASSAPTVSTHRPFSPDSLPSRFSAALSVSCARLRPILSASASPVLRPKSSLSSTTRWSSTPSSASHSTSRCLLLSRLALRLAIAFSSGAIFSSTMLKRMLAFTHAASGDAATLTRWMTACSKLLPLVASSLSTSLRMPGVILCASKLTISSFTARLPRNLRMLAQLMSCWPRMRSTPSSTSRIASGGIFRLRISLMLSLLMLPTALRAASSIGCTSVSSASMPPFCSCSFPSSSASRRCSSSTSLRRSLASPMDTVMCCIAWLASVSFWLSSFCCTLASLLSVSTVASASASLLRPLLRKLCCSTSSARFLLKMLLYISTCVQ